MATFEHTAVSASHTTHGPDTSLSRWAILVARLEAIDRVPGPDDDDSLIDEAGDLITKIMAMPAPDAAALQWKLDYLLNDGGESTGSYIAEFVAQTVADYHRFLGRGA